MIHSLQIFLYSPNSHLYHIILYSTQKKMSHWR